MVASAAVRPRSVNWAQCASASEDRRGQQAAIVCTQGRRAAWGRSVGARSGGLPRPRSLQGCVALQCNTLCCRSGQAAKAPLRLQGKALPLSSKAVPYVGHTRCRSLSTPPKPGRQQSSRTGSTRAGERGQLAGCPGGRTCKPASDTPATPDRLSQRSWAQRGAARASAASLGRQRRHDRLTCRQRSGQASAAARQERLTHIAAGGGAGQTACSGRADKPRGRRQNGRHGPGWVRHAPFGQP